MTFRRLVQASSKFPALVAFGALTLGALTACSDDSGPEETAPIPIEQFAEEITEATCEYIVDCGLVPDVAACLAALPAGAADQFQASVAAGRAAYDQAAARACVNELSALECTNYSTTESETPSCVKAIQGKVPAGGTCFDSFECEDSGRCERPSCDPDTCCAGTCVAPKKEGESCFAFECEKSLACVEDPENPDGLESTCQAKAADGAACFFNSDCASGGCDGEVCGTLPGTGQPCKDTCANQIDFCTASGVCAHEPIVGEPCGKQIDAETADRCVFYATCVDNVCVALPPVGQACVNGRCTPGAQCDEGLQKCVDLPSPTICK